MIDACVLDEHSGFLQQVRLKYAAGSLVRHFFVEEHVYLCGYMSGLSLRLVTLKTCYC